MPKLSAGSLALSAVVIAIACDVGSVVPPSDAGPMPATGGAAPATGGSGPVAGSGAAPLGGSGGESGSTATGGGSDPIGPGGAPDLGDGPIGWATIPDLGLDTTTGGGDETPIEATDMAYLQAAVRGSAPRVIHVRGHLVGRLDVESNKTIIGIGGSSITGTIHFEGSQNVILRNLVVVGENCNGDPMCRDGEDAINVGSHAHHLWFDHLDVSDGSDGNLDITQASDYITVSWTKFWYSGTAREHRFSNLIGASDNSPSDVGHLRITWHHNWWAENVYERMPRSRYGLIHVFNNLYTSAGNLYCVNAGMDAKLLVERNVFRGVRDAQDVSSTGNLLAIDNVYENTTGQREETGSAFEPPYDYELEPTDGLPEAIMQGAGVH